MSNKTHIGYNVYSLESTIDFYQKTFKASIVFINNARRSACLIIGNCEVNLFETKDFGGYHSSILKSLHIGFQLDSISQVDEIYQNALKNKKTVFDKPYNRFDGDYTFFIQDPDGMQLEVFFGNHKNETRLTV